MFWLDDSGRISVPIRSLETQHLAQERFQALLPLAHSQLCHLPHPKDVLRSRKILGDSPEYTNPKSDNLNCCLVHFADLFCQILASPCFHPLCLHDDVVIRRYRHIFQDSFMADLVPNYIVRAITLRALVNQVS